MGSIIRQAGAIPFRYEAGELRVLLITSRGAGRWVIPKGWIEPGASPPQAALQEAYEEAGIVGRLYETPLGSFTYRKRLASGARRTATVEVFALSVEAQHKSWKERAERRLRWADVPTACDLVAFPGLAELFRTLATRHGPLAAGGLPLAS